MKTAIIAKNGGQGDVGAPITDVDLKAYFLTKGEAEAETTKHL
jgi:hypothetical protein